MSFRCVCVCVIVRGRACFFFLELSIHVSITVYDGFFFRCNVPFCTLPNCCVCIKCIFLLPSIQFAHVYYFFPPQKYRYWEILSLLSTLLNPTESHRGQMTGRCATLPVEAGLFLLTKSFSISAYCLVPSSFSSRSQA